MVGPLDSLLNHKEQYALILFNKAIAYRAMDCPLDKARNDALAEMQDGDIRELAMAFMRLYPHWFTNGRGSKALSHNAQQHREVCKDVVGKLNLGASTAFAALTRLYDLSGDNAIPTGRRPLASVAEAVGKRTRTRTRRTHCKYHPNRLTQVGGYCTKCYSRHNTLVGKGVRIEMYPEEVVKEIMLAPRPSRKKPLYIVAQEIAQQYVDAIKEANENSTATA